MVAVVVEKQREREGFWQGLGLPFFPRCQVDRTSRDGFSKSFGSREKDP
jgi:hypothetical protein